MRVLVWAGAVAGACRLVDTATRQELDSEIVKRLIVKALKANVVSFI